MRELGGVRKRKKREVFVEEKKGKLKSCEEFKEKREMKRMKKKKKRLVTIGKNEEVGTHLMAKLCVV